MEIQAALKHNYSIWRRDCRVHTKGTGRVYNFIPQENPS